jgi:hypothetical protein
MGGSTLEVAAGGDLQAALDKAQPGDTVALQAGATFTGNFTLRNKPGSGWILIRSSALAQLPEGTRATPSHAAAMPRIETPNAMPAIATEQGAHHYRLAGLEVGSQPGLQIVYSLVAFGSGDETQSEQLPHDLVVDRCWIHGNPLDAVKRGVQLGSATTAVIDSSVQDIHNEGQDTQAIGGWNGPGPYKIVNNRLEGAGENVMFGGATPAITGLVPSDIEFRRNHVYKPLSWREGDPSYAGKHWSVKNSFELKNARRVLVDGNIFDQNWADAQVGFAIVLTPRTEDGAAPWVVVNDITFTNNIVRHSAHGINMSGHDDNGQAEQRCVLVKNNLWLDIGAKWGSDGRLWQVLNGVKDLRFEHNTAMQGAHIAVFDGTPKGPGLVMRGNIAPHNDYGLFGSGASPGTASLEAFFTDWTVTDNVFPWASPNPSAYPPGNAFPSSLEEVGFVDYAGGNLRLAPSSPHKGAASGKDPGADIDALEAATQGVAP